MHPIQIVNGVFEYGVFLARAQKPARSSSAVSFSINALLISFFCSEPAGYLRKTSALTSGFSVVPLDRSLRPVRAPFM